MSPPPPEIPYHYKGLSWRGRVIPRYTREEMGRVWSDANRYQKWLDVELAAADTLAEAGLVPKEAAARCGRAPKWTWRASTNWKRA